MVMNTFQTKKGNGLIIKDETHSKQSTLDFILGKLQPFFKEQGLNLKLHEDTPEKKFYFVSNPNQYHGCVTVLYQGSGLFADKSVDPPYYFEGQKFGVFFKVGPKSWGEERRTELSVKEAEDFLEFMYNSR